MRQFRRRNRRMKQKVARQEAREDEAVRQGAIKQIGDMLDTVTVTYKAEFGNATERCLEAAKEVILTALFNPGQDILITSIDLEKSGDFAGLVLWMSEAIGARGPTWKNRLLKWPNGSTASFISWEKALTGAQYTHSWIDEATSEEWKRVIDEAEEFVAPFRNDKESKEQVA